MILCDDGVPDGHSSKVNYGYDESGTFLSTKKVLTDIASLKDNRLSGAWQAFVPGDKAHHVTRKLVSLTIP